MEMAIASLGADGVSGESERVYCVSAELVNVMVLLPIVYIDNQAHNYI